MQALKHRAAFDVIFEKCEGVGRDSGCGEIGGIETIVKNGFAQRDLIDIGRLKNRFVNAANQSPTAEKRHTETLAAFFREANHFDFEIKPLAFQRFDEGDGNRDPENAVKGTGVGNDVEMRSDEQAIA